MDFEAYVEEISDVLFCYFPISFKAPPNDPYGITAEDLRLALRKCIAASPVFSTHSIPLLMEKMSSTIGSAKKDAMETILACAKTYNPSSFVSVSSKLYDYLKEEIVKPNNNPNDVVALEVLCALTHMLSKAPSKSQSRFISFLETVIKDVRASLEDPESGLEIPCEQIYFAIASASRSSCSHLITNHLDFLLCSLESETLDSRKKPIVSFLMQTIKAARLVDAKTELLAFKEKLMESLMTVFLSSNVETTLWMRCCAGLYELLSFKGFLSVEEFQTSLMHIFQMMLSNPSEESKKYALTLLKDLSQQKQEEVLTLVLMPLFESLDMDNTESLILNSIEELSGPPRLFSFSVAKIISIIQSKAYLTHCKTAIELLNSILKKRADIQKKQPNDDNCIEIQSMEILETFFAKSRFEPLDASVADIWTQVEEIISIVFRHMSTSKQQSCIDALPISLAVKDFSSTMLIMLTAVFGNARPAMNLPLSDENQMISFLRSLAQVSVTLPEPFNEHASKCLASIINKPFLRNIFRLIQ
jgi:DNA repair/transcription protein MET18/MMS19